LFASFLQKWKPRVAPCGSNELERLSHAGLEALLMQVQDDYDLRKGEDQLYLDATKPIRTLLRKRRRESVGPSPTATQVVGTRRDVAHH
jgi:hypothetical protein